MATRSAAAVAADTSSYANVCYVTSTREEVAMLFGMNQAWNRIVVSPYAAKRPGLLMQGVVNEYETRFGPLDIDVGSGEGKK